MEERYNIIKEYENNSIEIAKKRLFLLVMKHFLFLFSFFLTGLQVCSGQDIQNVLLQDHWTDTTIEKGLENAIFNDVWGFTANGDDYCALGSSIGTHIFTIKNKKLNFIDFVPGKYQDRFVVHRDFKTYKNYLYGVCDEGTSSLQIIDLKYLPDSVSKVYDSAAHFQICHNIFIDTLNAKLYASGPNNVGLKVFSLADPINPILIHDFSEVAYVHDCYVRNDTAYLNAGFEGLHVYNFAGDEPVQLGIIDFYPNQGYNHSGWLSPNGEKYAFIDETQGTKVKLCEIEHINDIEISETFGTKDYEEYVPHNIILTNKLAFVSYYNEGLRIFDLSKAPYRQIGVYDTFLEDTKYRLNGAWGVYVFPEKDQILVADRQNGLFLFSFPINALENGKAQGVLVTSTPFVDANSVIIPRDYFRETGLLFTISETGGKEVYRQESLVNYVNIPLELSAGAYVFGIYNKDGELLESGKFVKAN